jgi:hypothetical protein
MPASAPASRRGRRREALAATGVAAAVLLGAAHWVGRTEHSPTIDSQVSGLVRHAVPRAAAERDSRRYAWSEVPGTSEYAVTLLRGGDVVYRTVAQEPALTVPRTLRLEPGRYTWVVEAAGSTRRTPLLESTFVVEG